MILIQTQENDEKSHFGPEPKFGSQKKIWLRQSLDTMVRYHHAQYQIKLMIQSWENLETDGRSERRTDWRTDDKSDFMDAVRPKSSVQQEHLFVKLLII